jgi:hypothetical protein
METYPGEFDAYPIEDWTQFYVVEQLKYVKIATYRYPANLDSERTSPHACAIIFNGFGSHANR